jgi:hypothetical protein
LQLGSIHLPPALGIQLLASRHIDTAIAWQYAYDAAVRIPKVIALPPDPPWLRFVSAEIENLAGILSAVFIDGICIFWPSLATRCYAPMFGRFTGVAIRLFGYTATAWGAWSVVMLAAHVIGWISK